MTIADISAAATYTTIVETGLVDTSTYTALPAWVDRVKAAIPNYQKLNADGVAEFGKIFKEKLAEAKKN